MRRLLAALACLALAACTGISREAVLVLADIAAGAGPSELKATTPEPVRRDLRYRFDGAEREADVYVPGVPAEGGLVLVPGLTPEGRRDPRLVAFARTLARAKFLVLAPEVPGFTALHVGAADAEVIADAVRELASRSRCVGLVAISYAVGPAVLAAIAPATAPRLDLLVGIGGYYDHNALIAFVTTGYFRSDGEWRRGDPDPRGKWLFLKANAEAVADGNDRWELREIAAAKLADPEADVAARTGRLGAEGRAVMALLDNADPARVPALVAALPARIRQEIDALSLVGRDLSRLPHTILVHGRDDPVIPPTESVRLAEAIGEDRAELYLIDRMRHVAVDGVGLLDQFRLWQAVRAVLAERSCPGSTGRPPSPPS